MKILRLKDFIISLIFGAILILRMLYVAKIQGWADTF